MATDKTCVDSAQFDRTRVFEEQSRGICAREQIPRGDLQNMKSIAAILIAVSVLLIPVTTSADAGDEPGDTVICCIEYDPETGEEKLVPVTAAGGERQDVQYLPEFEGLPYNGTAETLIPVTETTGDPQDAQTAYGR